MVFEIAFELEFIFIFSVFILFDLIFKRVFIKF